jgi:8-oxo-dGTP pyrophosphatase MutT (NUDIX family)
VTTTPPNSAEPQPVVAAVVTSHLGVLVGRRNDGKPPWTFIAGEIQSGESPTDAVVREVREETRLLVRAAERELGRRVHPWTGRMMIYLACYPLGETDVAVGDEDELAEVRWVSLEEAEDLLPGLFEPVQLHLKHELSPTPLSIGRGEVAGSKVPGARDDERDAESALGRGLKDYFRLDPISPGHVIQIGAAMAITLAALRLYRVAGGDPRLAVAIIQHSGYVTPIVAMLLTLIPAVTLYSLVYLTEYRMALVEAAKARRLLGGGAFVLGVWLIALFASVASWWFFLTGLVLVLLYILANRSIIKSARAKGRAVPPAVYVATRRKEIGFVAVVALAGLIITQALSEEIWTSVEEIKTEEEVYRGAVLQRDGEWLTVLIDRPRQLEFVPADQVVSRTFCRSADRSPTIFELLGGGVPHGGAECAP